MKIKRIAHIGVAVSDVEQASDVFSGLLGLESGGVETYGEMRIAFFPVGESNIELVQSTTPDGVMAKFIAKRGEGIHHIALEVDDIDAAVAELKGKGVPLTSDSPRPGAHGTRVIFLHPKATRGVLVELVEYPKGEGH